jgi:hypothetical protein
MGVEIVYMNDVVHTSTRNVTQLAEDIFNKSDPCHCVNTHSNMSARVICTNHASRLVRLSLPKAVTDLIARFRPTRISNLFLTRFIRSFQKH